MTFDEAVQSALERVAQEDFEGALALFAQIQAAVPGNAMILRLQAKTYLKMGRYAEGVRILVELVRADPQVEIVFDLVWGLAQIKAYPDIVTICQDLSQVIEGDSRFLPTLGLAHISLGRYQDALAVLTKARLEFPGNYYVLHNLSIALLHLGRGEEAVECYSQGLSDWTGGAERPASTERLDTISDGYDQNELHNFFSDRLLQLYLDAFPGRRMKRVLELGTGTGLLASKLPASASAVTGVERSPAMLAQARARGVYGTLIEGDLPGILESVDGPFETILASCVLYYFADLAPFFAQAARLLEPGGAFVFSVDPLSDPREIAQTVPGEYAHSRAYLRRLAAGNGFKEVAVEIDRHRGPPGFWCAFRKG
jgi:SAM-dependent methyltransferase